MIGTRTIFVCERCGGDNVTSDAVAAWNVDAQQWELLNTFDNTDCNDCGGEAHLTQLQLQPGETYNRFDRLWNADRFVVQKDRADRWFIYHYCPDAILGDAEFIDEALSQQAAVERAQSAAAAICGSIIVEHTP